MTYTTLTRKQFNRTKLNSSVRSSSVPAKTRSLAKFEPEFNDISTFRSHKYGCETLCLGRSSSSSSLKKTISHTSFPPPVSDLNTSSLRISTSQSNLRPATTLSGFTKNSQSFQGAGWLGVTIPSSDKWSTEYRTKLDSKPTHNPPLRPNTRSLRKNKSFYI
jgi:hypothetical protein